MRQILLGSLALAAILLPAPVFSIVAATPWEVMLLRTLALISLSLLAALPWVATAVIDTRKRMRRWSIPGVTASAIYLISADPIYLIVLPPHRCHARRLDRQGTPCLGEPALETAADGKPEALRHRRQETGFINPVSNRCR